MESEPRAAASYVLCVAAQDRSAAVCLAAALEPLPGERGIRIVMTPVDEAECLVAERSSLVLSLWHEAPGVVRGTLAHGSGVVAYVQGTETLLALARVLGVFVKVREG